MRKTSEGREKATCGWQAALAKKAAVAALAVGLVAGAGALAACSPQGQPSPTKDAKAEAPSAQAETNDSAKAADDASAKADDGAKDAAGSTGMNMTFNDFTDCDPGLFEEASDQESYQTTFWVNDGNRGCNACHEDLWDTTNNISSLSFHMAASDRWLRQERRTSATASAVIMAPTRPARAIRDLIHNRHYGSKTFVEEQNGNCMSCRRSSTLLASS